MFMPYRAHAPKWFPVVMAINRVRLFGGAIICTPLVTAGGGDAAGGGRAARIEPAGGSRRALRRGRSSSLVDGASIGPRVAGCQQLPETYRKLVDGVLPGQSPVLWTRSALRGSPRGFELHGLPKVSERLRARRIIGS